MVVREKYEQVKIHIRENKKVYAVGAGCLTIGTAIGGAVVFRQFGGFPLEISQTAKNQALINWKPEITQIALVKKACPDPIPVLDKSTGRSYESIRAAAKVTGLTDYFVRKDVHGLQERFEELPQSVFA